VLLKDEASRQDTAAARYLWVLYHVIFAARLLAPYALAILVLVAVGPTAAGIAAVVAGVAITVSGNALVIYRSA
jgi:hypothetical protein